MRSWSKRGAEARLRKDLSKVIVHLLLKICWLELPQFGHCSLVLCVYGKDGPDQADRPGEQEKDAADSQREKTDDHDQKVYDSHNDSAGDRGVEHSERSKHQRQDHGNGEVFRLYLNNDCFFLGHNFLE